MKPAVPKPETGLERTAASLKRRTFIAQEAHESSTPTLTFLEPKQNGAKAERKMSTGMFPDCSYNTTSPHQ